MSRIKLTLPDKNIFNCTLPVRITDLNYGNHVGNHAFVALLHEVRVAWLAKHGFTELNVAGVGLIMADLVLEFKSEAFYGDIIQATLFAGEAGAVYFDLYYQLTTEREGSTIVLAFAKTGMVCYDYTAKQVALMAPPLKKIFQ